MASKPLEMISKTFETSSKVLETSSKALEMTSKGLETSSKLFEKAYKPFEKLSKVFEKSFKAFEPNKIKRKKSNWRLNMPVNVKKIREASNMMSAGWEEARDVEFNGVTKEQFDADRTACAAIDAEIEDDEARIKAKKDRRDDLYRNLEAKRVKVGRGVAGHKDFGDDHPTYGAMGFVRKSERRSGLTRKSGNNANA